MTIRKPRKTALLTKPRPKPALGLHFQTPNSLSVGVFLFCRRRWHLGNSRLKRTTDILYLGLVFGHGGDALQMLELAAGAAARGLRAKIAVPALDSTLELAVRAQAYGIPLERLEWLRADGQSRQSLPHLLPYLQAHRGSLLHFHTGDVCLPRSVMLAMELLRLPRAFATLHSPYANLQPGEMRARFWASAVARRMHCVFCPSQHGSRTQRRYGVQDTRVQTIHNGVNVAHFAGGDPALVWRALNVAPQTPLVVFSSRLEAQKRPLDALRAFENVAAEFPDVHLVFAGRGSLENELRQAAHATGLDGRIHLAGYRNNVADWLAAATVWMLPTESENFSLAVLEALAAGCPILSTQCPGNDEALVNGENALLTAVGDIKAQTLALRRLLDSPTLRACLTKGARETAAHYSLERMVEQYLACYGAALGAVIGSPAHAVVLNDSAAPVALNDSSSPVAPSS